MKRRGFFASMIGALAAALAPVAGALSLPRKARAPALPLSEWLVEPHVGAYIVPGDWGPGSLSCTSLPRQEGDRWYIWRAVERSTLPWSSFVRFERDDSFWWPVEPVQG